MTAPVTRTVVRRLAAAASATALLATGVAIAPTAGAAAGTPGADSPQPRSVDTRPVDAMAADWLAGSAGISKAEATSRIAKQAAQTATADRLENALRGRTGGSYIDQATGDLVVTVTDAAAASTVRAAGATARVVDRSATALAADQAAVTRAAAAGTGGGTSWYVDTVANRVVVTVAKGSTSRPDTSAFLERARAAAPVEVREQAGTVSPQASALYGGQQIEFNGYVCSLGFNVRRSTGASAFLTAGHCAEGYPTFTRNGVNLGSTLGYSFPGNDYAYSSTNTANFTPQGAVSRYDGYAVRVSGYSNAAVGTTICKSGRTTGWTCGVVKAKNATVDYGGGDVVSGLTHTNACSEGGDSGGSVMAGTLAQGMTSGGASINGRCLSVYGQENVSYFQPVGEALSAYGLTLVTS